MTAPLARFGLLLRKVPTEEVRMSVSNRSLLAIKLSSCAWKYRPEGLSLTPADPGEAFLLSGSSQPIALVFHNRNNDYDC